MNKIEHIIYDKNIQMRDSNRTMVDTVVHAVSKDITSFADDSILPIIRDSNYNIFSLLLAHHLVAHLVGAVHNLSDE